MKKPVLLCYVVLFLLSAYGALANLGHVSFWDDEAFVAMVGKRHLETGQLSGWTGRNLYGYANGQVLDTNLRPINPPLDLWVASSSFRIFGVSFWSARLPFAIAGLLALILFGLIVRREWPGKTATQLYAFGSLALSTGFLLNLRTARYYALGMLFSLVCYYAYQHTLTTKRNRDFLILALGATALFYANLLICVVFLCSLTAMHLTYHRKEWTSLQWRQCLLAVSLFLTLTLPYAIIFRVWDYPFFPPSTVTGFLRYLYLLNFHFTGWFQGGLLSLMVFAGIIALLAIRPVRTRFHDVCVPIFSWLLLVTIYTIMQAVLSPMPVYGVDQVADLRYYCAAIPFFAGLTGLCLGMLHNYSRLLAISTFVCLLLCNTLPGASFTWTLPGFIREIHSPYPTSGSETTKFLQAHARQDDVVRIVYHHHNYPVMFDMDKKLRFGALLDKNTHFPFDQVHRLGDFLFVEQTFPDWLIFFGKWPSTQVWLDYMTRPTQQNGEWVAYDYQLYRVLDVFYDQTQRPELTLHSFGPIHKFDRSTEAVYIYKRNELKPTSPPAPGQTWKLPRVRE